MSTEITRYDMFGGMYYDSPTVSTEESHDGEWVRYDDHEAAIRELSEQLDGYKAALEWITRNGHLAHRSNIVAVSEEATKPTDTNRAMNIRSKFHAIHIDTPERFVGVTHGWDRVSIGVGDMGMWECDVYDMHGRCLADEYLSAKDIDHAIAQCFALIPTP